MGPRKWIMGLLALFILSALWMPGCGDKDEDNASDPWVAQVVEVTPALGTYYVGGSEGVFNLVEDNTSSLVLELLPASPDLDPGNFLVGLDDEGFIREVLTQEQTDPRDPNWIIVDTTSATIPDAFTEFDLDLGINTGQTLTPGMVSSCIPNSACINFSNEVLYDDGTIRVTIPSGTISVYANYWGALRVADQFCDLHYEIRAEGSATLRFEVTGARRLNREVTVPGTSFTILVLIGQVPVTLKGDIKAGFTLDYRMDSTVDVTVDFHRGTVGSLYYDPSTGWDVQSTDLSEGVSPPSIDFTGEVYFSADFYLKPELSVSIFNVLGIGASVEPYLQVEMEAAWIPSPCNVLSWGKFWRGGIRADISAFVLPWLGIPPYVHPIGDWILVQGDEQSRVLSGTLMSGWGGDLVVLSGAAYDMVYADANGSYCFTGLPRGHYCVSAPRECFPNPRCTSIVDSDVTGFDFSCSDPPEYARVTIRRLGVGEVVEFFDVHHHWDFVAESNIGMAQDWLTPSGWDIYIGWNGDFNFGSADTSSSGPLGLRVRVIDHDAPGWASWWATPQEQAVMQAQINTFATQLFDPTTGTFSGRVEDQSDPGNYIELEGGIFFAVRG